MADAKSTINAQVVSVFPDRITITVDKLEDFKAAEGSLKVGSYLKIEDNEHATLIAVIQNFQITVTEIGQRIHLIEAFPLGILRGDTFERGGDSLAIPPKEVKPATLEEIRKIYETSIQKEEAFCFSSLSTNPSVKVPVDGNKFFNKHIAVVGSTGSGKSHTLTTLIQKAVSEKSGNFPLNNSHIIIFDIHSEYSAAFPDANYIDINNLVLPYWLLNSEELEEFFLDTEGNDHNQRFVFKEAIVNDRRANFEGTAAEKTNVNYDSPVFFDIHKVLEHAIGKNTELIDTGEVYVSGKRAGEVKTTQGALYGKLTTFVNRLENKVGDSRLEFLLGKKAKKQTFEETIETLMGYRAKKESNVTIVDLSGVPFEVLSITVSLISRLMFEYGYYYKRMRSKAKKKDKDKINNDIPILLVYEEAHKYVPNTLSSKYRASKKSIERIAKEGRKYGVTLLLASQRPSEISETIFSQCNNFISMRLTNPVDQSYVKKLLPDSLGGLIDKMTSFKQGEALLVGESIVIPSIVQIERCSPEPSSQDIPYWILWKEKWKNLDVAALKEEWHK